MSGQTMTNFLLKRVSLTPERTAIVFQGQAITFKELYEKAYTAAGKCTAAGMKQGDFTAVLLSNHLDTVVLLFACQLLGVKTVLLNSRLQAKELIWQIKDSRVEYLLTDHSYCDTAAEMAQNGEDVRILIKEQLNDVPFTQPLIAKQVELDDLCSVMYTSGTSGYPKGVLQTYGNHWWSAVGSALNLGLSKDDCWLCAVPLFHISGFSILMRSVIYGIPLLLHERFSEEDAICAILKENVTIISVVSTMLMRIVDTLGDKKLPASFRCMLLGGGPAPVPLLQECVKKNIPVFQTYGMTETASQFATLTPEYALTKLGSAGKPFFASSLKIVDDNGEEGMPGQIGEIMLKGPNVTKGYLYRPEETAKAIHNGWLATGDIGYVDKDGFLYVLDRRTDLIISGGENIYPAEIEGILTAHHAVCDAGVIGVEDEKWGQKPVAFIVKKQEVSEEELMHHCMNHLAKFKVPKQFFFLAKLPRNGAKKLVRRKLRNLIR
ncbi:o-succinylbenzoate--CoA ligase [Bacillaceae bacterium Marseille-Q3522]|nr:o-succinylbenzoate--CoA ligase [Bacillaceae bacterium Marseille-Q3522]